MKFSMQIKPKYIVTLALVFITSAIAYAESGQPVGRYTTIQTGATESEIDPLQSLTQIEFPEHIQTVYEAIEYLLRSTGFTFSGTHKEEQILKALPLPTVHRQLGPVKIKEALSVLLGDSWALKIDGLQRKIAFASPKNTGGGGRHSNLIAPLPRKEMLAI